MDTSSLTLVRVAQWWEVRRIDDDNYVKSKRLHVSKRKKDALKYLREIRKLRGNSCVYKLCHTTETTEFEYRKD